MTVFFNTFQPPAATASFFERMKFIIEDQGLQSYVQRKGFNERSVRPSIATAVFFNVTPVPGMVQPDQEDCGRFFQKTPAIAVRILLGHPVTFGCGAVLTLVFGGLCTIAAFYLFLVHGNPALIGNNLSAMCSTRRWMSFAVTCHCLPQKKRKMTSCCVETGSLPPPRVAHVKAPCANFSSKLAKNAKTILGKGTAPFKTHSIHNLALRCSIDVLFRVFRSMFSRCS